MPVARADSLTGDRSQRANVSMCNITELLQVRGDARMQRHSKRKSRSTLADCDLTRDSTHRVSDNMHDEENIVGSKAMCWNATSPSCAADTYGPHASKKKPRRKRKCWNATTSRRVTRTCWNATSLKEKIPQRPISLRPHWRLIYS